MVDNDSHYAVTSVKFPLFFHIAKDVLFRSSKFLCLSLFCLTKQLELRTENSENQCAIGENSSVMRMSRILFAGMRSYFVVTHCSLHQSRCP